MPKRNRKTLKDSFRQGKKPTQQDFENLIDSMINILDDGLSKQPDTGMGLAPLQGNNTVLSVYRNPGDEQAAWEIAMDHDTGNLEIGKRNDESMAPFLTLFPDGSIELGKADSQIRLAGEVHLPSRKGSFLEGKVPANGKWHDLTAELEGCWALEVVAGCGRRHTGKHALLIATAVHCFGKHARISKNSSWYGYWGNRLRIRWQKDGFKAKLQIKTVHNYGEEIFIRYHIARLWDTPYMDID